MAKHYHTGQCAGIDETLRTLNGFLSAARSPALLEYGDDLMPLNAGAYTLEIRGGRLWIDAWHENRSVSRSILSLERQAAGIVDCLVHSFGGAPRKLSFLDLARPRTAHRTQAGERGSFAEQFRRMLTRQFPAWQIAALSTSMDLQRSLSPVYPRARLTRGGRHIVAMACPDPQSEAGLLTFALIWFHQIAASHPCPQLCLFLPEAAGALTAHRLRWLNSDDLRARLFRFNEHGSAGEVDPADLGNLDTRVSPQYRPVELPDSLSGLLAELTGIEGVGVCPEVNGELSLRSRGVQFGRIRDGCIFLGLASLREALDSGHDEAIQFARQLASLPSIPAVPERWLECAIRAEPSRIDPCLRAAPLHGQVLTFAGLDRDLIDLLGVRTDGQLAVLELKAAEDIHLPMQALDYWMRVRWHAERGELTHLFPGVSLSSEPPRLLLVAPALAFHPAIGTVLRYFSPAIDVERVGVNSNWHEGLKVAMRLEGAAAPQSHRNIYEHSDRTP